MKRALSLGLIVMSIAAFTQASDKKLEQAIAAQAEPLGFSQTKNRFLDRVYFKPDVNLKDYQQLQFAALDVSKVEIRQPPSSNYKFDEPWVLTDKDRAYLQQKYLDTFNKELIESGDFKAASGTGKTLLIKTSLLEIAPSAVKDDIKSRDMEKIYTEGAGTMNIKMEIYDAQTNALIGLVGDQSDLGNRWEENNRATNSRQVSLAFSRWANSLGNALNGKK